MRWTLTYREGDLSRTRASSRRAEAVRLFRGDRVLGIDVLEVAAEVPAGVVMGHFREQPYCRDGWITRAAERRTSAP